MAKQTTIIYMSCNLPAEDGSLLKYVIFIHFVCHTVFIAVYIHMTFRSEHAHMAQTLF